MRDLLEKLIQGVKGLYLNLVSKPFYPSTDTGTDLSPLSEDQRRLVFREFLTRKVSEGWSIEIENPFDAVLSKKQPFSWIVKFFIFIILLLVFLPLAIFYLIVVVVRGVNTTPYRQFYSVDEFGRVTQRAKM